MSDASSLQTLYDQAKRSEGPKLARQISVYVEWESEEDPLNPFNWSRRRKWCLTSLACAFCFSAGFVGSSFSLGISSMESELHNLHELSLLGISTYPAGFAFFPLITAPFSEIFGRRMVWLVTGFLCAIMGLPVGLSNNITGVIIGRFLAGCFASTGSTLSAGVLSDLWQTSERGNPLAVFSLATFASTATGPMVMGFVAFYLDWRWIQYIQVIMNAVLFVLAVAFLPETRGTTILTWKAQRLRRETGDKNHVAKAEAERKSISVMLKTSLLRPLYYLVSEPIVTSLSIWLAFLWACLWGFLAAVQPVFSTVYGFNTWQSGLAFTPALVGTVIALFCNVWQERLYARNFGRKGPEARLYFACVGGILCGSGIMIFAWTQSRSHWVFPMIGIGIFSIGIYAIYNAVFTYLADCYTLYASSAIAAQSFARNALGCTFPLFVQQMYFKLTFTWASFLLAMVAFVLAIIPFVLFFNGPVIRSRSKVSQELFEIERKETEKLDFIRMQSRRRHPSYD